MIGFCPNCGKQIFKMKKDKACKPLGNYRSISFQLEDGRSLKSPMCMDCHDDFSLDKLDAFLAKLVIYLEESCPPKWPEEKKAEYAKNYTKHKILGFKKEGVLKHKEIEGGQIWK